MDIKALLEQPYTLLYQHELGSKQLLVKETNLFRWFELGDHNPQSMMNTASPEKVVIPVYQLLLSFMLFKKSPLELLSLGLGGGSIERYLHHYSQANMTSVDSSQVIIDMAKQYFKLPEQVHTFCQPAERFIANIDRQYDVIICDLFVGIQNPPCLQELSFYQHLHRISPANAVLMLNLKPQSESQLLKTIVAVKQYFPHLILFELSDFSNVVVMCGKQALINQSQLQTALIDFPLLTSSAVEQAIESMHVIN